MPRLVRPMSTADAGAVLAIYGQGIASGHATFQDRVPTWPEWNKAHLGHCRLVAETAGKVTGFAALSVISARPVYGGVAEVSVYVADSDRGRGGGRMLLEALIDAAEAAGPWTLQAGIFPENLASLELHQSCGFREVGRRVRLGRMSHGPLAGQWRDVVLLDRRSAVAGIA